MGGRIEGFGVIVCGGRRPGRGNGEDVIDRLRGRVAAGAVVDRRMSYVLAAVPAESWALPLAIPLTTLNTMGDDLGCPVQDRECDGPLVDRAGGAAYARGQGERLAGRGVVGGLGSRARDRRRCRRDRELGGPGGGREVPGGVGVHGLDGIVPAGRGVEQRVAGAPALPTTFACTEAPRGSRRSAP